ncbi:hypothetical protein [Streptomyces sp. NPDC020141]|uniref:hypothetical protein n=1 Tax=Streptomyces sp. NPDC020141 TaxID=3365065 RepID=UPI0037B698E7
MTVHSEERPGHRGIEHASDEVSGPHPVGTKVRVLVVLLAVVTGVAAALAAYITGTHVGASGAERIVWAAATFVATTTLAIVLAEKTGLIE